MAKPVASVPSPVTVAPVAPPSVPAGIPAAPGTVAPAPPATPAAPDAVPPNVAPSAAPGGLPAGATTAANHTAAVPVARNRIEAPRNVIVKTGKQPVRLTDGIIAPESKASVTAEDAARAGKSVTIIHERTA